MLEAIIAYTQALLHPALYAYTTIYSYICGTYDGTGPGLYALGLIKYVCNGKFHESSVLPTRASSITSLLWLYIRASQLLQLTSLG
jgi:hypothetical protein